jgi:hypothetical protein
VFVAEAQEKPLQYTGHRNANNAAVHWGYKETTMIFDLTRGRVVCAAALCIATMTTVACAQNADTSNSAPPAAATLTKGTPVLASNAHLSASVGGQDKGVTQETISVTGQPFAKAVRVILTKPAKETNETQMLLMTSAPVSAGDTLVADLYLRGSFADGKQPARAILMFEKTQSPWTKSTTQAVGAGVNGAWKRVVVPFTASESYKAGEAMLSLRLALGAQTIEIGGVTLTNYGKTQNRDALLNLAAEATPLGNAQVSVNMGQVRQTMVGLGGNYCKGRFGQTEPNDAVGRYTLENLNVAHARVGIPLERWTPTSGGQYKDEGPVHGTFELMRQMSAKNIPLVASIWEAPDYMVANPQDKTAKRIKREQWGECIEAITQWLVTARDKYHAPVQYVSFNEADGGYNIKFTSAEIAEFMRRAIPRFERAGLKTKWLVGDTANGKALVAYATPLLEDKDLEAYLGPISFHSWDALNASDTDYMAIAQLGRRFRRPVLCLEMGYDPQLWQASPPVWDTWENGLKLAQAYHKAIHFAESTVVDYWEYQADYPLVGGKDGNEPYPAFFAVKQFATALPPGAQVVQTSTVGEGVMALAAKNPKAKTFSVVLLNTTGAGSVTLSGLPKNKPVTITRTSAHEQMKAVPTTLTTDNKGSVTVPAATRSLTTVSGSL